MLEAVRLRDAAAALGVRAPILVLCAAAFLAFAVAIPGFASTANVTGILIAALPLLLLAAGQTFVLISAGIDLSRSEEHTSELQSQSNLVCRLLLEKKNK